MPRPPCWPWQQVRGGGTAGPSAGWGVAATAPVSLRGGWLSTAGRALPSLSAGSLGTTALLGLLAAHALAYNVFETWISNRVTSHPLYDVLNSM